MENRNLSLYELTSTGKQLESMFFYGEIDEETLKDSKEFLLTELKNKSNSLVILFKLFDNFIGKNGSLNNEIERLKSLKKEYETRFEDYKARLTECMYSTGMTTGKTNGIMTDKGILTLTKSQREVPVDINTVEEKYKKYEVKLTNLTKEELEKIEKIIGKDKIKSSEPKLDKELYKKENEIKKQQHFSVTIK